MNKEEAIERVKARFDKWVLDEEDLEALRALGLVPIESEDERIRKDIIHYILYKADGVSEEQEQAWIAYLEKENEQKPLEEFVKEVTKDKESAIKFLKSAGIMDENGELAEMYCSEQKPVWSEEDEEMLEDIKFNFVYNKEKMTDALIAQYNRFFDKIKSLKPQPRQEWSEEDEAAFGDLMWCIEQARKSAKDENDMGNIWFAENWLKKKLKSLRPHPHWKPSEEQMELLNKVYHYLFADKYATADMQDGLGDFIDELKEIKEKIK